MLRRLEKAHIDSLLLCLVPRLAVHNMIVISNAVVAACVVCNGVLHKNLQGPCHCHSQLFGHATPLLSIARVCVQRINLIRHGWVVAFGIAATHLWICVFFLLEIYACARKKHV